MSADNGIYIASFPDGTMRVAYGSDSVVMELDSHYYSPEDSRDEIERIFGSSPVFTDKGAAVSYARTVEGDDYTEYGICDVSFEANFGELRGGIDPPQLPEGACEHCSSWPHAAVSHGANDSSCRNPALPRNIIIAALQKECRGINPHVVTRIALEALDSAGCTIIPKEG